MGGDGGKVRGKLLKIFLFPPFLLILRVNKMRGMGGMRVKYSPSFFFPPLHLIFPNKGNGCS